jgi:hypothetical protein
VTLTARALDGTAPTGAVVALGTLRFTILK